MKNLVLALLSVALVACSGDDGAEWTPDADMMTPDPQEDMGEAEADAGLPSDSMPATKLDTAPATDTKPQPQPVDTMPPKTDTMPQVDPERSPPRSCEEWRVHAVPSRGCIVITGASYWLNPDSIYSPCTLMLAAPTNEKFCFYNKFANVHYYRTKEAGGNMVTVRITATPNVANCPCL